MNDYEHEHVFNPQSAIRNPQFSREQTENMGKKIIAEGRYIRVVEENHWEYIERKGALGVVAMVAVTGEGNILLVEQYRESMKGPLLELPAGLVGDEDEAEHDFAAAAKRELLEETGYEAGELVLLIEGPSSSGLSNEVITFFQARDLVRRHEGGGVAGENIKVHEVPLAGAQEWLEAQRRAGIKIDPRIYIGLYFAERG
jgi:ADP-ribose pyrophosphatase